MQLPGGIPGRGIGDNAAGLHDNHPVCRREHILRPVLGNENGGAQLPIDFFQSIQEVGGGNGVQLAGGLVQNQNFRLHGHNGGQIQQLLLPAGKLCHLPVEPVLDAEEAGHLCHPQTHDALLAAQIFQAEGQLMPYLIRDDLIVRVLHHEADFGCLLPQCNLLQRGAVQQHTAAAGPMGGEDGFQVPQQGSLSTAGPAAQQYILPLGNLQVNICQRRGGGPGIGEAQILEREIRHAITSLMCRKAGISSRQQ